MYGNYTIKDYILISEALLLCILTQRYFTSLIENLTNLHDHYIGICLSHFFNQLKTLIYYKQQRHLGIKQLCDKFTFLKFENKIDTYNMKENVKNAFNCF